MSSNTPSSDACSLSPGEESRFVPHSSVLSVDASAATEHHVTAASTGGNIDGKDNSAKEIESVNVGGPMKQPDIIVPGDHKEGGIVGATICFTPEPSPRLSPNLGGIEGAKSQVDPLPLDKLAQAIDAYAAEEKGVGEDAPLQIATQIDKDASWGSATRANQSGTTTKSEETSNYIGSVIGSGVECPSSSKLSSSVLQVASSLDGRSVTSYEVLDGISSKGSIEVEDLDSNHGGSITLDGGRGASANSDGDGVEILGAIDDIVGRKEAKEENVSPLSSVGGDAPFEAFKSDSSEAWQEAGEEDDEQNVPESFKSNMESEIKEGDSITVSPKVDRSSLTPFKNLQQFWESRPSFARMTKNSIAKILRKDPPVADPNEAGVPPDEAQAAAEQSTGPEASAEKNKQPPGTHIDDSGSFDMTSTALHAESSLFMIILMKSRSCLSNLTSSVVAFVAWASLMIRVYLAGKLSFLASKAKAFFARIIHKWIPTKNPTTPLGNTDDTPPIPGSPDKITGTNLSQLFSDEASEEKRESALSGQPTGAGQAKGIEAGEKYDHEDPSLDQKELARLEEINGQITAGCYSKCKKALFGPVAMKVYYFVSACAIAMMTWNLVSEKVALVDTTGDIYELKAWSEIPSIEAFSCFSTHLTTYPSMSLFEADMMLERHPTKESPGCRLSVVTILSAAVLSLFAVAANLKLSFGKANSYNLTGIWTREEHKQFIAGYNAHGNRWTLVSAFVPTRTPTQVKNHGNYWLKIRSPEKMKYTRKAPLTPVAPTPRKTRIGVAPNSVSSSSVTPMQSNKTPKAPTKGILIVKDVNQHHKHVTPRSAERKRKMMEKQAKSDSGKKTVRIKSPKK